MDKSHSSDPRSVRARKALQQALLDLIRTQPFTKITITDIAAQAGLSRHTFYNHYETKEELLNSFVDGILDGFFDEIGPWDVLSRDPEGDLKVGIQFFQLWQEHTELIEVLKLVDLENLLLSRLRKFFRNYYYTYGSEDRSGMCEKMGQYIINLNAYSWASMLNQWFKDGMDAPPELLGDFLNHFIGIEPVNQAIVTFNYQFKEAGLCGGGK